MGSKIFDKLLENQPDKDKCFIRKSLDIAFRVREILKRKRISEEQFAKLLDVEPDELTYMLSGFCNLDLETITQMESVLGCDIFVTTGRTRRYFESIFRSIEHLFLRMRSKIRIRRNRLNRSGAMG